MSQFPSVFDYLFPAQIADVEARTETVDVSTGVQYAITQALVEKYNTLLIPAGAYRLDQTVYIPGPLNVIGAGKGSGGYPYTQAPTEFVWHGGLTPMMVFGANGKEPFTGGGLQQFRLDGRQTASEALRIIDCIRGEFKNLSPENAIHYVTTILNTPTVAYPTGEHVFENIWINSGLGVGNSAIGLLIDCLGEPSTDPAHAVAGVALCTMISVFVQTDQGPSIKIGNRGDNFVWLQCSSGGQNPAMPGVWFAGDADKAVVSTHKFLGFTGSFRFDNTSVAAGHQIIDLNMADVSSPNFIDPNNMISGPGATEVTVSSNIGFMWGQNKTLGYRETIRHDAMQMVDWNRITDVLLTSQGAWKTLVSVGGAVRDAGLPGGAIALVTGKAVNSIASIYASPAASGLRIADYPNAVFSIAPVQYHNVIYRFGWVDSNTKHPANGIYIEADSDKSLLWRFVCVKDGVESYLESAYVYDDLRIMQFRIDLTQSFTPTANFFARANPYQFFESNRSISTNVPDPGVPLSFVFQTITTDGVTKELNVHDFKLGFNTEN